MVITWNLRDTLSISELFTYPGNLQPQFQVLDYLHQFYLILSCSCGFECFFILDHTGFFLIFMVFLYGFRESFSSSDASIYQKGTGTDSCLTCILRSVKDPGSFPRMKTERQIMKANKFQIFSNAN